MSTEEADHVNGTAPLDPLAPIIAQLEEQLAPISAQRAQLEAALTDLMRQEERIKGGISALRLRPRPGGPAKPAPVKRPAPDRTREGSNDWTPSQKTLDAVYAVFAEANEPLTTADVSGQVKISRGTIVKAVEVLRVQERLRLCGTAPRKGSPRLFQVMP